MIVRVPMRLHRKTLMVTILRQIVFALLLWPIFSGHAVAQDNRAEFLDPDQAFKVQLSMQDARTVKAHFTVAPGHYVYRSRTGLKLDSPASATLSPAEFPPGDMKNDENFGRVEVYHHDFDITARLMGADALPPAIGVTVNYQGCAEKGLCYPPVQKTEQLVLSAVDAAPGPTSAPVSLDVSAPQRGSEDEAGTLLSGGNLWLIMAGFFGFGLLLSFTPCVLPMIPILLGIIVGQGAQSNRSAAVKLSVAYVLGMSISYTLAGIAAGLSGQLISAALQNVWVLSASALVFVLLSLSMFGFYELKMPSAIESRVLNVSTRMKGGRFVGVLLMGTLSALIVSPCVAAPLAGALIYIGRTHDVVMGGLALMCLSLGMGMPLIAAGASAGALLPRAGKWMESVRNFFGVLMLGMAIMLIGPVIPHPVQLGLWAALLIIGSIYLHALDPLPAIHSKWAYFWKGVGVIALLVGVNLLYGAANGGGAAALSFAGSSTSERVEPQLQHLPFKRVKSEADLDAALAGAGGKTVMLDFYADWCTACKEYEKNTFADASVRERLGRMLLLQADVTGNTEDDVRLMKRFNLFGPPGIVFFGGDGVPLAGGRIVGYQDASQFLQSVGRIVSP